MESPLFDNNHPMEVNSTYINQRMPDFIGEVAKNAISEENLEYLLGEILKFPKEGALERWAAHEIHCEAHRLLLPIGKKEHQEISNPDVSEIEKYYICYCFACKIKALFFRPVPKYTSLQKRERILTKNKVKHPRVPKSWRLARARRKAPWFKMKQATYDRLYGWADER